MHDCECGNPEGHVRSRSYPLPLCDECWKARTARGMEGEPDALTTSPIAPEAGAVPWEYRPPEVVGREGCDLEIEIGGRIMYQQRPPTHAPGQYRQPRTPPTAPRDITEAEATRELERRAAAAQAGLTDTQRSLVARRVAGLTYAQIAAERGVTVHAVRQGLARARKAAKST